VIFGCNLTETFKLNLTINSYYERVKRQVISPMAFIRSVSYDGLVTIGFNTTMKPPDDISLLKNSNIVINETTYPVLSVYVMPGKYSDKR